MNALINTPVFLVSQGGKGKGKQITVRLSYYLAQSSVSPQKGTRSFSKSSLKTLIYALTQLYESAISDFSQQKQSFNENRVNVQLELLRQNHPYMDATILAQYLAINLSTYGFNRVMNRLLNVVPYLNPNYTFNQTGSCHHANLCGIKVQLSGLLTSQRNRSRQSVYTAEAGTFHNSQMPSLIEGVSSDLDLTNPCPPVGNQVFVDYDCSTSKSGLGAYTVKV